MLNCFLKCLASALDGCREARIVITLSEFEEAGNVKPTPQYHKWPVFGSIIMAFTLVDSQKVTITPKFVDKKGNPARVDGKPEWLVDNPNVLALTPADDGLSCVVAAVGPLGTAKVSLKADADLGEGVKEIGGFLDVEVVGGEAVSVELTPGEVSEQ